MILLQSAYKMSQVKIKRRIIPVNPTLPELRLQAVKLASELLLSEPLPPVLDAINSATVHCVIAAGGLAPDHARWISSRRSFFLPFKVLGRAFSGKFVAGLKAAFRECKLEFHVHLASLAEPNNFAAWLGVLFRHNWVVYSKRPFGGPEHALRFLGAYTHRVGISNCRLVAFSEGNVSLRWLDSAHGNKKRVVSLPVDELLGCFLLHLFQE